jgi:hypothetical protein
MRYKRLDRFIVKTPAVILPAYFGQRINELCIGSSAQVILILGIMVFDSKFW